MSREEYNKEPVEFCKYCDSLFLVEVKEGVLCENCKALNYVSVAANIEEYLKKYAKNNDKQIRD